MKKELCNKIKTGKWALVSAIKINKAVFFFWIILSVSVAVLPALAVCFYQRIISALSMFIDAGGEGIAAVVPYIVFLGLVLVLNGLSGRINGDFLYMLMYDYYHLGLQEMLMDSVQRYDMKKIFDKEVRDEYKAIMRRAGSLTDFMSASCRLISEFVSIFSLLLVAFHISPVIAGIAALYIIVVIFISIRFAKKARLDFMQTREIERRIDYYQSVVTTPGVAKEMRIYNTKSEVIDNWEKEYEKLNRLDYERAFWLETISFISGIIFYLYMSVVVLISILSIANGNLGVDAFVTLYILGQNISNGIKTVSYNIQEVDRGLFSLERQRKFIMAAPKEQDEGIAGSAGEEGAIGEENVVFEADKVSFSYDGRQEILHDVSFQIKKGETIALVGENGSGKSTLVKLLLDLYQPTGGSLYFYGVPYSEYSPQAIQSRIGMFFQNFCLFHASLRENVGFGDVKNIENRKMILEAIDKGGCRKLLNRLNDDMELWLKRDVKPDGVMLSGGEQQKIAIARSHMSNRPIVIFDEPASALDPLAEMEQFETIKSKVEGSTAVLISHRVGFARMADRIFVLDQGRLVEVGTHDELLKKNGKYAQFFNMQAEWYQKISE